MVTCAIRPCDEPMDEFILVQCEVPPVRHEFVELEYGGINKKVLLDDSRAVFEVPMCLKHGMRVVQLRTHGKRAVLPVATFGPLKNIPDVT